MRTRVLIGTAIWNEEQHFPALAERMDAFLRHHQDDPDASYQFLVIDDGSDRPAAEHMGRAYPFLWHRHDVNRGAGTAVRQIYEIARQRNCEVAVTIAGNGKDDPDQIPDLLQPILEDGYDLVQGSRYLPGGGYDGTPAYRILATRYIHPRLLSLFTGTRITDSTNGFRAVRVSILADPGIRLDQDWLDRYELEPYLLYMAIRHGYRVTEVPVRKIYPTDGVAYTKMRPLSGWWSILRPLILLGLGLRR